MKKRTSKLQLHRETVLQLDNQGILPKNLEKVLGGIVSTDDPFSCLRDRRTIWTGAETY